MHVCRLVVSDCILLHRSVKHKAGIQMYRCARSLKRWWAAGVLGRSRQALRYGIFGFMSECAMCKREDLDA